VGMSEKITEGGVPYFRGKGAGYLQDLAAKHNKPTAFRSFDHAEQAQEQFLPCSIGATKPGQFTAFESGGEILDSALPERARAGGKASNVLAKEGAHGTPAH